MSRNLFKVLVLIIVNISAQFLALNSMASTFKKDIFLKEANSRLSDLLKNSYEAQTFIREDLFEASKVLEKANIKWSDSVSEFPLLFTEDGKTTIFLSKYYSFQGPVENKISSITTILFHLKRQLENSRMPLPALRIELFSKKFSPMLLGEGPSCSVSLYPIPFPLTPSQREKFYTKFLSLLDGQGMKFSSKSANTILWLELKTSSDTGCFFGENRNIAEINLHMLDLNQNIHQVLATAKETACGFNSPDIGRALNKVLRKMKHNLQSCNSAAGSN